MPDPTPTLTAEQRTDLIGVANAAWEHGAISVSALAGEIEETIARMVADAEQRGRELGSRAEAALWRQQIEDRDRSGIMALDRQLAEEEGYERGWAEVSAAVEAVLTAREESDRRESKREPEDWQENREHYFQRYGRYPDLTIRVERVRAALTDPAAAVARIKAEAWDEGASEAIRMHDRHKAWMLTNPYRADRIGGGA